jgi:hypothetical protein
MRKFLKKVWIDPVWSKVLGAIILALISGIVEFFTKVKPLTCIFNLLKQFIIIFAYKITIPIWGLILIALPTIFFIVIFIIILISKPPPRLISWQDYKMDNIDGIKWVWSWYRNDVSDLIALCPVCMCELESKQHPYKLGTDLYCQKCDKYIDLNTSMNEFKEKVKKEIRRRVRTGEYKDVVLEENLK